MSVDPSGSPGTVKPEGRELEDSLLDETAWKDERKRRSEVRRWKSR